jgi:hypothetical protein
LRKDLKTLLTALTGRAMLRRVKVRRHREVVPGMERGYLTESFQALFDTIEPIVESIGGSR